jgi:hypothetical protein
MAVPGHSFAAAIVEAWGWQCCGFLCARASILTMLVISSMFGAL